MRRSPEKGKGSKDGIHRSIDGIHSPGDDYAPAEEHSPSAPLFHSDREEIRRLAEITMETGLTRKVVLGISFSTSNETDNLNSTLHASRTSGPPLADRKWDLNHPSNTLVIVELVKGA